MENLTPDLCDKYSDLVRVVEPIFSNFGGRSSFGGEIVTVKCFEDNSVIKKTAGTDGHGKVMVVDGGASMRAALLGDLIAANALQHGWQGFIIYGCVRDVDTLEALDLGVQALNCFPRKSEKRGLGDLNVPVTFGGVDFVPGEYVYADNNGIIVSAEPLSLP
jgi:regulator of ribonuclease activity A